MGISFTQSQVRFIWVCFTWLLPVGCIGCALPTGILKSRWAMDDPDYAAKYEEGAEKSDIPGKLKQAADARFQKDTTGKYLGGGVTARIKSDDVMGAFEYGNEYYHTSYLTQRVSLSAMGNEESYFLGIDTGIRLQTPTRLAPFVGAGISYGITPEKALADQDGKDNDDDGIIDENKEMKWGVANDLLSIYPEAGVHFWWTPGIRMTGYSRYMITSEGRESDDWLIGAGLAFFSK